MSLTHHLGPNRIFRLGILICVYFVAEGEAACSSFACCSSFDCPLIGQYCHNPDPFSCSCGSSPFCFHSCLQPANTGSCRCGAGLDFAVACAPCGPGRFSNAGDSTCTSCSALGSRGLYNGFQNADCASQRVCFHGYDSSSATCAQCPAGEYYGFGVTSCTACPSLSGGIYLEPNANLLLDTPTRCFLTRNCFAGYAGNNCDRCSSGTYSTGGSADSCSNCPVLAHGTYTGYGTESSCSSAGVSCDPGYAGASCTLCLTGHYSTGGTSPCVPCPALDRGSYMEGAVIESAAQCAAARECDAGYGTDTCGLCGTGTYSPGGNSACTACPGLAYGYYVAKVGGGLVSQADCAAHRSCTAGYGTSTCGLCEAGYYSTGGNNGCYSCPRITNGRYVRMALSAPSRCSWAVYCDGGHTGNFCNKCTTGYYSPPGSASVGCFSCPTLTAGSYPWYVSGPALSGTADCNSARICDAGYGHGTTCEKCPAGQWSAQGDMSCTACPAMTNGGGYVERYWNGGQYIYPTLRSEAECYLGRSCGTGRDRTTAACNECPSGYYSDGYSPCYSCPLVYYASYPPGGVRGRGMCAWSAMCNAGYYKRLTYSYPNHWAACVTCGSATYAPRGTSNACHNCPTLGSGSYGYSFRMQSRADCAAVRSCSAGYGGDTCQACDAGHYSVGAQQPCLACPALGDRGNYSLGALPSLAACVAAQECVPGHQPGDDEVLGGCIPCAAGEHSDGSSSCIACPDLAGRGSYGDTALLTSSADCAAARVCDPGTDGTSNTCQPCSAGEWSTGGDAPCLLCPTLAPGSSYTGPSTEASCAAERDCLAGHDGASPSCVRCSVGEYSTGGLSTCQACPTLGAGSYQGVGTEATCSGAGVRDCPAGYDGTSQTCAPCAIGLYSTGGTAPCAACPTLAAGSYVGAGTDSTCDAVRRCPAGHGGSICAACASGEFSTGGSAACTPCAPLQGGSYIGPSTDESCAMVRDCDAGFDGTTLDCAPCDDGFWSTGGYDVCTACTPLTGGVYTGAGTDQSCAEVRECYPTHDGASLTCAPCGAGEYSEGGAGTCLPCPTLESGSFTGPANESSCAAVRVCSAGYNGASDTCAQCLLGEFSVGGGAACEPCPTLDAGVYTGSANETTCEAVRNCDAGHNGAGSCEPCDDGAWSGGGLAGCEACPTLVAGSYFGFGTEDTCADVKNCSAGADGASETCAQCPMGKWSAGGTAGCLPCTPHDGGGFLSNGVEETCYDVRDCAPSFDGDAAEICAPCPLGAWSEGGQAACEACPDLEGGVYTAPGTDGTCVAVRQCDPGFDGDSQTCAACPPGHWSEGGSGLCEPCPALGGVSWYHNMTLTSSADCPLARHCEPGYGGDVCDVCGAELYSEGGAEASCLPCEPAPERWVFSGAEGLTSTADCLADIVCLAGHGGEMCTICHPGTFSPGGVEGDPTPECTTCEEAGEGKPPNSEYHPALRQSGATACLYECNAGYALGSRGACDAHALCLEGHFHSEAPSALGGNGSCWAFEATRGSFAEARQLCQAAGGEMAELSDAQDAALFSLARDTVAWVTDIPQPAAFFGLSDRLSEGTWSRLDGATAFDLDLWAPGHPGDPLLPNIADCAVVGPDGAWLAVPCESLQPTVCVFPLPPAGLEACNEESAMRCHVSAECVLEDGQGVCSCPEGMWGDGMSACSGSGWTVRFSLYLAGDASVLQPDGLTATSKLRYFAAYRQQFAALLTPDGRRSLPVNFLTSMEHSVVDLADASEGFVLVGAPAGSAYMVTLNAVFGSESDATAAFDHLLMNLQGTPGPDGNLTYPTAFGVTLSPDQYPVEPRVYRWVARTTGAALEIDATGMTVESVHFEPNCAPTGCWVVELLFTTGTNNFNTFFLPHAVGDDSLATDFYYGVPDATWGVSPLDTFTPSRFPCGSDDYDPAAENPLAPSAPAAVTSCCIPEFSDMYRPVGSFVDAMLAAGVTKSNCDQGRVGVFARPDWTPPPPPGPEPYSGREVDCGSALHLSAAPAEVGAETQCFTPGGPSGRISHAYSAGDSMAWMLAGSAGSSVEAVFRFLETAHDADWLRIYQCDTAECVTPTLLVQGSGAYRPFSVASCTGFMLITLDADPASPGAQGFMADWYELPVCPYTGTSGKSLLAPTDGTSEDPNREVSSGVEFLGTPANHLYGNFKGMESSYVAFKSVEDPYIGQYRATVYLDEVELRQNAGMLRGTVGVEHTVDTYIGLANFKPTGIEFLDSFATRTALHFEKTSFFSVATHGVNDYTFLEYVNLRLIAVYLEDTDPTETASQFSQRTNRTSPSAAAHYLQVTFTMGAQYRPIETGLIPLDSVRVGQGTFLASATVSDGGAAGLFHACSQYAADDGSFDGGQQATFDSRFPWNPTDAGGADNQQCGPNAQMCESPSDTPDSFVAFNVPLGIDWLPAPSSDLASNVFVELVVSAVDQAQIDASQNAPGPNDGAAPEQMKTTLSASIPVVEGGVNIFCDGLTAKTDLTDIVAADLVFGSAGTSAELSRLRMMSDIASSNLRQVTAESFDTNSIEAGLMTLVVRGNASYFTLGGTGAFGVAVEDVVTVHILEASADRVDGFPSNCVGEFCERAGNVLDQVMDLLEAPPDDNADANGLLTGGYPLNGGFDLVIDRATQRASLSPSRALLSICPTSPNRPTASEPFPTSCVLRRDMRQRAHPFRAGSFSTSLEIPAPGSAEVTPGAAREQSALFMQSVLGESDYAADLGRNFSLTIARHFAINGRYRRAFWINPGYEWTPTQTGGRPIFSVSQKLVLFALVTLDEGLDAAALSANDPTDPCRYRLPGDPAGSFGVGCSQGRRRRVLLSTAPTTVPGESGVGGMAGAQASFAVSARERVAEAVGVASQRVATMAVSMALTRQQACAPRNTLRADMQHTLASYLAAAATELHSVSVMSLAVSLNGVQCRRGLKRSSLDQQLSEASAAVELAVVFAAGDAHGVDGAALGDMPGVLSFRTLEAAASVSHDHVADKPSVWGTDDGAETGGSSGSSMAIIAAAAAGGAVVLAVAAVLAYRRYGASTETSRVVAAVDLEGLRSELGKGSDGRASPQLVFLKPDDQETPTGD